MSGFKLTPEQISQMDNDLNNADQAFDRGDYPDEAKDLFDYYQEQAGNDGYAKLAEQVVMNTGLYGAEADSILAREGHIPYLSKNSSQLMDMLADDNYATITGLNKGDPETEAQIEQDHANVYRRLGIPISD